MVHGNSKKASMALLMLDKITLKSKSVLKAKEGHDVMRVNSPERHNNYKYVCT
jgi:hypothetical protein